MAGKIIPLRRPTPPEQADRRSPFHKVLVAGAATALVGVVIGLCAWQAGREERALLELRPAKRALVYEEELANFERLCSRPATGLEGRCREKASFLRRFPDCDERCQAATSVYAQAGG